MNERDRKRNMNRTRKNRIVFYVDDDELKFIKAKMQALGIKNREAYMRKMAIDGQCIRNDYSAFEAEIRKTNYLIDTAAKNINQIAKRVNSTDNIYAEDVSELQGQIDKLRKRQVEIMKLFVKEVEEK